ncbi:PLP-dependent aminotransferase family protein [Desulfovibrio ferrophilus]|uniref:Transcriptional regulator, GntR family with aminotransferase domain-containing protein n=1 Tax=Desulfovibrio ferrophilus TaxID=241368 RepID=A0A2Z6B314_9BACT|nr:PLP-dependent aminotransferase family protein [Desulfovibrio ferrophilus]BBD09897.1 transcriptional regulator, GntR family with aminotransferase domain-containing protein [Desulfovibrio ferrophilus]
MQTNANQFRYQAVEDHVMGLIDTGALTPGDKLPSLRKLSTGLNASISTINQAYVELERKGVVESRPRSGFYVRAPRRLPTPSSGDGMQAARPISRTKLINAVLESVGRPDLTPLGIICPSSRELLPGRQLARIMASVLREQPHKALEYETIPGNLELRKQISLHGLDHGTRFAPEDVIITAGAMEALYISLRTITRPGDTVLIMSPTYFCFLQLVETLGLRAIEIPSHPEYGIDPGDIRDALDKYDITASVLCPNFNNPDGSLTSESAKAEIVTLLAERGVPLVEDDVYGDLHFGDARPRTFKAYDTTGTVILCSSFSKTIAPGYRVGWMVPGQFRAKALEIKATTNVCSASPTQMALAEFLRQGLYDKHLKRLRVAIHKQRDVMLHHVGEHFPEGTRATRPKGGSVLWVELPGGVNCVDYFYEAKSRGIGVAPGSIFSTQDKFKSFIRLSLGGVWDDIKERGIIELGQLAKSMAQSNSLPSV